MKRPGIKFVIAGSLLLGLAITLFILFISMKSIGAFVTTNAQVFKRYESSRALNRLVSNILRCESATRGYSIWGDTSYIANFEEDANAAFMEMERLKKDMIDSVYESRVRKLEGLVKHKIAHNRKVQYLFKTEGKVVADLYFGTNIGKLYMDSIHLLSRQLEVSVERNIRSSISQSDNYSKRVLQLDLTAAVFAILLVLSSILLLFRDIDRRHKLEVSLWEARRKAEVSAQLKEQFMANMSHEIRTPLNAILGFANLIGKTDLDDKQEELLRAIKASGDNLLIIVNDILDFSRIEEGMLMIHKVPFSLGGLLQSVETMFKAKAKEKKISLSFHKNEQGSGRELDNLEGDPTRLTQILVNLIGNALKFTDQGSVSVHVHVKGLDGLGVLVEIAVQDSGIGIPSEQIDKIFDRFHQGNADTTRRFGGTGLGLTIVKRLVELQGGEIHVASTTGLGSTFTVSIPYQKALSLPEDKPSFESYLHEGLRQLNILVVEDNPMNQRLTSLLLSNWGFGYDIAENGLIAVELLKKNKFDLVLMDIQMPEMDGYQSAEAIRHTLKLDVPIVAMTAHAMPGEREKCLGYGMDDYIAKPIQESVLYDIIQKLTSRPELGGSTTLRRVNLGYLIETSRGNTAFVKEMCDLFLTQVPVELDELSALFEKSDWPQLASHAHAMKSTLSCMGLGDDVLDLLHHIEESALHRRSALGTHLQDLRNVCNEVIVEVKGILSRL